MGKTLWRDRNDHLDPETDFEEIYRTVSLHEFPWDMNQSLSFALFRTYAVPSVGRLLGQTQEFTGRVQKRYDDTALLLEVPLVEGFESDEGRAAVRRINQMHKMYDISQDDFRYVLATFVVVPKRWLDDYGWRPLTQIELRASVNYYRKLGQHMGIRDIPETYEEFADLMDAYEREHFAFDEGGRRVADSTLQLMTTFYPKVAAKPVEVFSRALMDQPLLDAFRYDTPSPRIQRLSAGALRARAALLRHFPSRRKPKYIKDMARIRSYPDGFEVEQLGTFSPAAGCPVPHGRTPAVPASSAN